MGEGYVFHGALPQGLTPPLGGVVGNFFDATVYHGGKERRRRFLESSPAGSGLRVDPCSGCGGQVAGEVASDGRSLCHCPQLQAPSLFFSCERPHGSWDRCVPSGVGRSAGLCLSSIRPYSSGSQQAPLLQKDSADSHSPVLATKGMVPRASESLDGSSSSPSLAMRSSQTAPFPSSASEPPCASVSCVATIQRFARHLGLSRGMACQLSLCHRLSSRCLYQHCWECYRAWCASRGHSVSSPLVSKIVDLLFLRAEKQLSVSALKGYQSTLASVFKYRLPDLQDSFILRDLIRFFELERPQPVGPPAWDLVKVLFYLRSSVLEPLSPKPFRVITMKGWRASSPFVPCCVSWS